MIEPTTDEATLGEAILDAARDTGGLAVDSLSGLKRLSGGASKEMWAFELQLADGASQRMVLRRQPPAKRFSSQGLSSVSSEARLVRLAAKLGVPVPQVFFTLPDGSPAGDGYAMERIDGETVGVRVLKLPELADARAGLARRCGEVLAKLHAATDFRSLGLREQGATDALAALEQRYRDTGQDRPVFELALRWLKDNLPNEKQHVLLHGDFRNGNLVIAPEGLRAVLDWELSFIGPPVYDLAWPCVTSWRFQRPDLPVGGFGTREDLIAGYESAGGAPVDRAELHAWEVFQTMNWGVMCSGVAQAFMDGSRSVEGGVIARRASETEFDLMRLLAPDHEAWNVR
ncbi:phosphotransferase family protein [Tsuneonella mangrovi]|uniref:phosphotransferase family protein n=1 Tax=Tsuneonella mangrovi TaxID=1982042 RepID=UPI000BA1C628|nr:phosphotransferase family protein [Tsuneonella mangrovi]